MQHFHPPVSFQGCILAAVTIITAMITYTSRNSAGSEQHSPAISDHCRSDGPWLFVCPHDDDAILGAGMLIPAAIEAGIDVHMAIVTDGSMGYCDPAERDGIAARRREECRAAIAALGLAWDHVHWLDFPDAGLAVWQGARQLDDGSIRGIAYSLTRCYRELRPACVWWATGNDLHPDHRITAKEAEIACFFANAGIWRELGEPCPIPECWEYAVYCPFDGQPDLRLRGSEAALERKLAAIRAFSSQSDVIEAIVQQVKAGGAWEYFARATFSLYRPDLYHSCFSDAAT